MPGGPDSISTPNASAQHEVEDGLDEAHDGHAREMAGEESAAAHRRQRESVEEAVLDVAGEVGAGVHGREQARPG